MLPETPEEAKIPIALPVPAERAKRTTVEVKTDAGSFLFAYHVDRHTIEVHKRGQTFTINVQDLIDFGRTSERRVFRVDPENIARDLSDDVVSQEFE